MKVVTNCKPHKLQDLGDMATFTWDGGFYACLTVSGGVKPMMDNRFVFDLQTHRLVEMPVARLVHLIRAEVLVE